MKAVTIAPTNLELRRLIHCHHLRSLAFGLAVGILINKVHEKLEGPTEALLEENAAMSLEILGLAEIADTYRPFGSLAMSLFLGAAWAGAPDMDTKDKIDAKALEYCSDIYGLEAAYLAPDTEWCRKPFSVPLPMN